MLLLVYCIIRWRRKGVETVGNVLPIIIFGGITLTIVGVVGYVLVSVFIEPKPKTPIKKKKKWKLFTKIKRWLTPAAQGPAILKTKGKSIIIELDEEKLAALKTSATVEELYDVVQNANEVVKGFLERLVKAQALVNTKEAEEEIQKLKKDIAGLKGTINDLRDTTSKHLGKSEQYKDAIAALHDSKRDLQGKLEETEKVSGHYKTKMEEAEQQLQNTIIKVVQALEECTKTSEMNSVVEVLIKDFNENSNSGLILDLEEIRKKKSKSSWIKEEKAS